MTSNQHVDGIDALLDLSEYDHMSYQSPSVSPAVAAKNTFAPRPSISAVATPIIPSASQPLTGPSHQYELYKQQTGIVPGALASTLAVNEANSHITGYNGGFSLDYLGGGMSPENDLFDFNTSPSQNSTGLDMDMEFESPSDSHFYYQNSTINPNAIDSLESPVVPSQQSNVGRVWPGMHSQAALAKAQAQQRQQQQIIQQQQQQQQQTQQQQRQQMGKQRTKSQQPSDPIVEQKITQLLNSMRAKTSQEDGSPSPLMNLPRPRKDEEDMDEDERLLASEEGKKLSSKERRQLRNKVSARAFRSRRKEYITQLEAEIATKVTENGDLRAQNRALADENKRLSDLTRMLLSSPSFSNFLDHLSTNPQAAPQPPAPIKAERQTEQRQIPKDVNPYHNQGHQQQIGMAMMPEQTMDFSMLNMDNDAFNFQPQVFTVQTPEVPVTIDTNVLSGKSSNFVGETHESDDDKIEIPTVEAPKIFSPVVSSAAAAEEEIFDDDFENDPEFALYHSSPASASEGPVELNTDGFHSVEIFGGVESEKVLARYELIDASEEEKTACLAMAKVQRIAASLEPVLARLEALIV
ncbi:BZIP-type transcription factor MBZ1 [Colletotrichum sidae]|uniref:BZIP-type transcription factor MBZ1 n=1 Tax=Colletotrichum sidae TaxID=1347389 RepID=A0A4R8TE34_9PEZI|nr:BZIP-type transcription factor MBZ1 [Colletotrichum sidae]